MSPGPENGPNFRYLQQVTATNCARLYGFG